MDEQVKQQGMDGQDKLFGRDAVELSRNLNAHIGIVAYGKGFCSIKDCWRIWRRNPA